jgi:hypothetical protein
VRIIVLTAYYGIYFVIRQVFCAKFLNFRRKAVYSFPLLLNPLKDKELWRLPESSGCAGEDKAVGQGKGQEGKPGF